MKRAVFLDRDGTIIEDTHYPNDPKKVVLIPGAIEGMRLMQAKGYLLFVVSNQSGVGRGIIKDDEFKAVHERVCELLQSEKIEIAEFAFCFHHPDDGCNCRKPQTGLIPKKFKGEELSYTESFGVGDKQCDLELAQNIGAKASLVLTGKGQKTFEELQLEGREKEYPTFDNLFQMAQSLPEIPA